MSKTRAVNYILMLGMIFLSATQLQLSYFSITPGSVFLLVFVIYSIVLGLKFGETSKLFILLYAGLLVCFSIGLIYNELYLVDVNSTTWHDIRAYCFVFLVVMALRNEEIDLDVCVCVSAVIIPLFYVPLLLHSGSWYNGERFSGLSANPNQFAFALLVLPFLLVHYYKSAAWPLRVMIGVSFLLSVVLGYLTVTHALLVAWF